MKKYKCPSFIKDELHRGIFGMFVRFYPLFDEKYEKNLKFITDIDYNDREVLFFCKYAVNKMLKYTNNCMCIQKIGYEWKYANYFKNEYLDGTCLSNLYIKNVSLPKFLLENTLVKLRDDKDNEIKNMMTKMYDARMDLGSDENKFGKNINTFTYGIDEWFVNKIVLNHIIENNEKMGVLYVSDNLYIYPKGMINWNSFESANQDLFFKTLLGGQWIQGDRGKKGKNLSLVSKNLSIQNKQTIEKYDRMTDNIRKFYKTIKEFKKEKKIVLTEDSWLQNLEKHVKNKYIFNFVLFLNEGDNKNEELFIHLCNNMEISDLDINKKN